MDGINQLNNTSCLEPLTFKELNWTHPLSPISLKHRFQELFNLITNWSSLWKLQFLGINNSYEVIYHSSFRWEEWSLSE